jgi:Tol biopolymer transport system component
VLLELRWIEKSGGARADAESVRRAGGWLPWAALATTTTLIGGAVGWLLRPVPVPVPQPAARFDVPLSAGMPTQLAGWQGAPALSPDGRYLALASAYEGRLQLFVRRMDSSSFVAVAGTEDARVPFWSPDSGSIGFFAGGKLRRVAPTGDRLATICEVNVADGTVNGATWSRDGTILFAAGGTIRRVSAAGGSPVELEPPDRSAGRAARRLPVFLPDGRTFLYAALGERHGVRAGFLDGRTSDFFLPEADHAIFVQPSSLVFVREQSVIAVPFDADRLLITGPERTIAGPTLGGLSASAGGTLCFLPAGGWTRQLYWYDRDGRRGSAVGEPATFQALALSPSGRRVALQRGEFAPGISRVDIWLLDLSTGVLSRLTSDPGLDGDPAWAPDEQSLVFTAQREGRNQVFRKDLSTGVEEPLLKLPYPVVVDDWSPDGRFVIFRSMGRAIHAMPMVGDRTPRTIVDTPLIIEDQSHVSPDGRWIAFNSNESGRWEVYVATFPDITAKRQVSVNGGVQALWRADGRELFYLDPQGALMVLDVDSARAAFGVPKMLFRTAAVPSPHVAEYGVAPDGRRFLLLDPVGSPPPAFTFLFNWTRS